MQPVSSQPYIWLINHNIKFFKFNLSTCSDIDAPSNLATTEVTEDTVTLSWDGVQAEVEGYMLSYMSAEGSSSDIPVGRDRISYRLIGLKPGVLHSIYIWAFKEDKVSKKSSTEAETGELWRREWNW